MTGTVFSLLAIIISLMASCGQRCFDTYSLRPGHTLFGDFQPWNVITYLFLEASYFRLLFNLFNIIAFARRVEAPTGQLRPSIVFKAILKPVLFAAVLMFFMKTYKYTVTFSESELYNGIYGTSPIIVAYSVLVWQQYGDKPVMTFLPTFCTGNYIPTIVLLSIWILEVILRWSKDFPLSFITFFVSWVYMRFFAENINQDYIGNGRLIGDAKETFQFITLLPPPLRFLVRPIDRLVSSFCLPILRKVVVALNRSDDVVLLMDSNPRPQSASTFSLGSYTIQVNNTSNPTSLVSTPVPSMSTPHGGPGSSPVTFPPSGHAVSSEAQGYAIASVTGLGDPVADRRREKALKALDKRLSSMRQKLKGTNVAPVIPVAPPIAAPIASALSNDYIIAPQDNVALSISAEKDIHAQSMDPFSPSHLGNNANAANGQAQARNRDFDQSQSSSAAHNDVNLSISPSSPETTIYLSTGQSSDPSNVPLFDADKTE